MSSRSRYTSPLHASARFVAQRGLLKPLVWRLVTVHVLGEEHLEASAVPSWWCPIMRAISMRRSSSDRCRASSLDMSPPGPPLTTSSTCGGARA